MEAATADLPKALIVYGPLGIFALVAGIVVWVLFTALSQSWKDRITDSKAISEQLAKSSATSAAVATSVDGLRDDFADATKTLEVISVADKANKEALDRLEARVNEQFARLEGRLR